MFNPRQSLREFVDDYKNDEEQPIAQIIAVEVMEKYLSMDMSLEEMQKEVGRTVQILQAFFGRLACINYKEEEYDCD